MSNKKSYKVSVIIPVYNSEKFLSKCLDSILNQTLRDIEVICINDGSTDSSLSILEEYAKQDTRITVITQENRGQGSARNRGIDIASGEFIGFIDSDDWIDLNFYEKLYNSAIKNNAEIAVAGMIRKRKHHQKYRVQYKQEIVTDDINEKIKLTKCPQQSYTPNKIYKKEKLVDEFKLKFPENVVYEDILFFIETIFYLKKLVTVPNTYYWYRVNMSSTVKKRQTSKMINDKKTALIEYVDFTKSHGIILAENDLIISKDKIKILGIPLISRRNWINYSRMYLFDLIPISSRFSM